MDGAPSLDHLLKINENLRIRLEEAEETLQAIRHGEVDALLVSGPEGAQVFTLQSAEQPYRILIEQMQEGAVTLSREGTVLYCNLRFAQMLKIPHERILASEVTKLVVPEQAQRFINLMHHGVDQSARAEITLQTGDGKEMPTYITMSPLPAEVEGCICMIVTDLTEQESMRRTQELIEALNIRLRRAMTETHHRVKNSLQIMSALVDMHVLDNDDFIPTQTIRELNRQVRVLATVHDVLTEQSKEENAADAVSSKLLLTKLLSMLQEIAAPRPLKYTIDDSSLFERQPIALALIVNELVLNALKHGQGNVNVTFCRHGETALLEVCDDGDGLPDGFDPSTEASTGMALIGNLVSWDLQGSISYQNRTDRKGTRVTVRFPLASGRDAASYGG